MSKRLTVIVCSFLAVSIVLLGCSFARQSGKENGGLLQEENGNLRVVYSDNVINQNNKKVDLSFINRDENIRDYYVYIDNVNNIDLSNVKYKVDNGEEQSVNGNLLTGTLSEFGMDGDQVTHSIEFIFDGDITFNIGASTYDGEVVYGS